MKPIEYSDIESETRVQVSLYIGRYIKKGEADFFFLTTKSELHQFKGMSISIIPQTLSAADKMNGVEWKCSAFLDLRHCGCTTRRG